MIFWWCLVSFLLAQENPEAADSSETEDTPVVMEEIAGDVNLTGHRAWRPPSYMAQNSPLGYDENTFEVPPGLETNFKFWLDIYTKYTTDQGVLHDSEDLSFVYEALDFSHIASRSDLTNGEKEKARRKAVKDAKKRVEDLLTRLHHTKDPSTLSADEKRIWDAFANDTSKNKFLEAKKKNRLRLQLGLRDRTIQGIFFSGRYLEDFEKIFADAGLPLELTRLVFVESSFNVLARSKVGASGLWQIMRATGRPYMMINDTVDKRNHPIEATKMAAKLLRNNYVMLQSWPLAITGYNHGPSGVQRLTRIHKTRDISELVSKTDSRKRLGFASRNFYACFLAALEAERKADYYFGNILWSQPLNAVDFKLEFPILYSDVLRWFDGDDQKAQIFNPQITSSARKFGRSLPRGAVISVPKSKLEFVIGELEEMKKKPAQNNRKRTASSIESAPNQPSYVVQRGDSLWTIGREFGVSHTEIMKINNLKSTDQIFPGQVLQVP